MTTELMVFEANGQEVELTSSTVKDYLVNGNGSVTDQEVMMFMELCKYQQLNPFLKEAYLIKYSDKSPAQIVVGKEAYMKRAQAQPDFERFEAGIIIQRNNQLMEVEGSFKLPQDALLGGWAKIYRKGIKEPNITRVSMTEYSQEQSLWIKKPATMIRKVAIVQAIRETYPEQFGGMYIDEEVQSDIVFEDNTEEKKVRKNLSKTATKQTLPGMEEEDIEEEIIEADIEEVEDEEEEKLVDDGQIALMFDLAKKKDIEPEKIQEFMKENYKKDKTAELTIKEYIGIIEWIDGGGIDG